jgi:hypothetical protein
MIEKITVGQELPAERWKAAAEHLKIATPYLAAWFKQVNYEGMGEQDAAEFSDEMALAILALMAVAANPGMCRFIPIPGKGGKPT